MHLKSLITALLAFILLSACDKPPSQSTDLSSRVKKFQQTDGPYATCIKGNVKQVNQTLLLVDLTDKLEPNQIQFVRDNYIKDIEWNELGDTFALTRMTKQPPEEMKVIKMCAPTPLKKDNGRFNKGNVNTFKRTYEKVFEILLKPNGKDAKNSLLIESIRQVYTNARYDFSSKNGPRHFILVSDLYQNSSEISFFKCNPKDKKCSFENTRKNKSEWFEAAKLNLKETDRVTIYHLSSKCRADLRAKDWWEAYFISEGAGSVETISELGTNKCSESKPIVKTSKPPVIGTPPKPPKPPVIVTPPKPPKPPVIVTPPKPPVIVTPPVDAPICEDAKAGPNGMKEIDIFCD